VRPGFPAHIFLKNSGKNALDGGWMAYSGDSSQDDEISLRILESSSLHPS